MQVNKQAAVELCISFSLMDRKFRNRGVEPQFNALQQDRMADCDLAIDSRGSHPGQMTVSNHQFEILPIFLDAGVDVVEEFKKAKRVASAQFRHSPGRALIIPGYEIRRSLVVAVESHRDRFAGLINVIACLGVGCWFHGVIPTR